MGKDYTYLICLLFTRQCLTVHYIIAYMNFYIGWKINRKVVLLFFAYKRIYRVLCFHIRQFLLNTSFIQFSGSQTFSGIGNLQFLTEPYSPKLEVKPVIQGVRKFDSYIFIIMKINSNFNISLLYMIFFNSSQGISHNI